MTDEEIGPLMDLLQSAVSSAYDESELLENSDGKDRRGNEQTIVFRVGIHLHELLKSTKYSNLNLDCEYNKHGDDPKRVEDELIRPDLLIHSRSNDDNNILVVEFAGWWKSPSGIEKDESKLQEMTKGNGAFRYFLGVLVKIEKGSPDYIYYKNGERIS